MPNFTELCKHNNIPDKMDVVHIIQLANEGKFDEAEKEFSQLIEKEGASAHLFAEWARMEVRRGNREKSLRLIEKSEELAPGNAEYVFEKGVILFHCGKKSLALLQMDAAVQMEPANPFRYAGRAYIKDGLGDLDGAISDYEVALKLDPEDSVSHNNLGLLMEKKGWKEKSAQRFKKADELAEKDKLFSFLDNKIEPLKTIENEDLPNEVNLTPFFVMKRVFTDKQTREEFWEFIKSGIFNKNKPNT